MVWNGMYIMQCNVMHVRNVYAYVYVCLHLFFAFVIVIVMAKVNIEGGNLMYIYSCMQA